MKIKHKVIKEFQYLSPDKKIFILNVGTILEEYNYRVKTEIIPIDRDIIDVDFSKSPFSVTDDQNVSYFAQTIIIATGSKPNKLGIDKFNFFRTIYFC